MIDINEIAALLHVEEKLRAHGSSFKNMLAAVQNKLKEHEAAHTPKVEEPAPALESGDETTGEPNRSIRRP